MVGFVLSRLVERLRCCSGGTGFWAGNRLVDENPTTPPDLVLKPPRGSALVFGGDVTHAGMPVEAGIRSVLVCSFSTVLADNHEQLVEKRMVGTFFTCIA